eukprot:jgi/Mesen1/2524/ME000160S01635
MVSQVEGQIDMVHPPTAAEEGGNSFVNETVVLSSWGSCRARNESRLELCRRVRSITGQLNILQELWIAVLTCASFAVCTALACDNIGQHDMANIAGGCYKVCNEDSEGIISTYAKATCYDAACALNDTASFLGVYKDFTYCHPDPNYDGRSSLNGLQGLSWGVTDLTGFSGTPKVLPGTIKAAVNTTSSVTLVVPPEPAPWLALGPNNIERMETLQVAVARSLYQWPKEPCTCPQKYYLDPTRTGQKLVAVLCSYLGGPTDLPACNYTHPATGRQLTTLSELNRAMAYAHHKLGLVFAQDEQDAFLDVLINNIAASASLPVDVVWAIHNRLHQTDEVLVNREWPPGCNSAYTTLNWRRGVDYETHMQVGSTLKWVWADDDPHSIREVKLGKGPFVNFEGVGSGKLILSRSAACGPDNSGFLNVTQLPPVPCTTRKPLWFASLQQPAKSFPE